MSYDEDLKESALPVLSKVLDERQRQQSKWGWQNPDDGTGPDTTPLFSPDDWIGDNNYAKLLAQKFTNRTDARFARGHGTWKDIFLEEVFEALAESDHEKLKAELIQVAAVAVAWVEAIDRRA